MQPWRLSRSARLKRELGFQVIYRRRKMEILLACGPRNWHAIFLMLEALLRKMRIRTWMTTKFDFQQRMARFRSLFLSFTITTNPQFSLPGNPQRGASSRSGGGLNAFMALVPPRCSQLAQLGVPFTRGNPYSSGKSSNFIAYYYSLHGGKRHAH